MENQLRLDLLLKGGRLLDPASGIGGLRDLGVRPGRVVRVAAEIPTHEVKRRESTG